MGRKKKQAQILYFPIQMKYKDDLQDCYDPETIAFYVRLWATRFINAIQHGRLEPTESVMEKIHGLNVSLSQLGKQELPIDFL